MFAVKDKRTGKFLKAFSGSFNYFEWCTGYHLRKQNADWIDQIPSQKVHDRMFCLDTPDGAKLYKTKGGAASIGKFPWLEIVEVQISVAH